MDGIRRKIQNDTHTPDTEVVRRAPITPEPRPETYPLLPEDRISSNPFFKKSPVFPREIPRIENPGAAPRLAPQGGPSLMPSKKLLVSLFSVATLGVCAFFGLNFFASARIEVVPLTENIKLDSEFTATKEGGSGALIFHFMSLSEEKSKDVPATTEQSIQKKASGKVVIYNAYSAQSQRLIKNTRLETSDHKTFRIDESVVVPGAKMNGAQVSAPGSVEAVVYADAPGKEYNIGLADFTIPGFKGDPRYAKFTARSKEDSPISGGFSGTVKVPSPEDVTAAQKSLKDDLKSIAIEKARAQVPEGVTFFPGSMVVKFEEVPQEFTADEKAKVVVKATVSVFFFDTDFLTEKIVASALPKYIGTPIALSNKDSMAFTFTDSVDSVVLSDLTTIRFRISGDAVFVGDIDSEKIAVGLVGKEKGALAEVINAQSNIKKAIPTIFPPWKTTFPSSSAKISVKIVAE